MVNITKRMRVMNGLLDVRLGPGAALISHNVTRIHLSFAKKWNQGHLGPRKFWHQYLPRLKYHNPAVMMTVEVTDDQSKPALMSVYFSQPQSSTTSQPASSELPPQQAKVTSQASPNVVKTIEMTHRREEDILRDLLKTTNGTQIEPTTQEEEQIAALEEQRRRSEEDRQRVLKHLADKKKEEDILKRARQSIEPT